MIRDRNIQWARQRMYIPVWHFQGYLLTEAAPNLISSQADGPPALAEFSTLEMVALSMAPNDSITHIMEFPSYWNISEDIGCRVVFGQVGATAGETANFIVLYDQADDGEAIIAPATVLTTAVPLSTVVGATTTWTRTGRGIINGGTFDESALDGMFAFNIELDADGTADDEIRLFGISWDYIPMLTVGRWNAEATTRAGF